MKVISSILFTLIAGVSLTSASNPPKASASTPPGVRKAEVTENNQPAQVAQQTPMLNTAIKVIAPQKDLETAIRTSELGDILLLGTDAWYRLDAKTLRGGTKVFVLGNQGSMISTFPRETKNPAPR
jgi:hypothetical protein